MRALQKICQSEWRSYGRKQEEMPGRLCRKGGRDSVRILEAGFGSGLNAWLTLEYARRHGIRIDYRAVERYPVDAETACGLGYTEDTLFADLHRSAWDR